MVWKGEKQRHSMAKRGIKTNNNLQKNHLPKFEIDFCGRPEFTCKCGSKTHIADDEFCANCGEINPYRKIVSNILLDMFDDLPEKIKQYVYNRLKGEINDMER